MIRSRIASTSADDGTRSISKLVAVDDEHAVGHDDMVVHVQIDQNEALARETTPALGTDLILRPTNPSEIT